MVLDAVLNEVKSKCESAFILYCYAACFLGVGSLRLVLAARTPVGNHNPLEVLSFGRVTKTSVPYRGGYTVVRVWAIKKLAVTEKNYC